MDLIFIIFEESLRLLVDLRFSFHSILKFLLLIYLINYQNLIL